MRAQLSPDKRSPPPDVLRAPGGFVKLVSIARHGWPVRR